MGFRSREILRQRLGGRSNSFARKRLSQNQRSHWSYYTRHFIVSIAEQSLPPSFVVFIFVVVVAIIIIIVAVIINVIIVIVVDIFRFLSF